MECLGKYQVLSRVRRDAKQEATRGVGSLSLGVGSLGFPVSIGKFKLKHRFLRLRGKVV